MSAQHANPITPDELCAWLKHEQRRLEPMGSDSKSGVRLTGHGVMPWEFKSWEQFVEQVRQDKAITTGLSNELPPIDYVPPKSLPREKLSGYQRINIGAVLLALAIGIIIGVTAQ